MLRVSLVALALLAIAASSLLLLLSAAPVAAVTTKVSAGEQFCVVERVEKEVPLTFRFKVTAGGKLDLDVDVIDSNGQYIQQWRLASEGHHTVRGDSQNTFFKFCFSNTMARWTPKWVNFFIHKGIHPAVAPRDRVDPIESSIMRLSGKVQEMRDVHDELKIAEHDHRNTIEDVNERVLLWNVIQTVVLVAMGIIQIFFIKRFLEVKTSV
jgi:hypothetical protein